MKSTRLKVVNSRLEVTALTNKKFKVFISILRRSDYAKKDSNLNLPFIFFYLLLMRSEKKKLRLKRIVVENLSPSPVT
jgi:hypothetical protein